jgi:hypothetical protein
MKPCRMLLAVGGATLVLGALTSSASAGRFSSSVQVIRATWVNAIFSGPFGHTECEITLGGSLHIRVVTKMTGLLIGHITTVTLRSPCRRGSMTILRETLSWVTQYDSFSGTLPNITSIRLRIIGFAGQISEGFICLFRSTAAQPALMTLNREAGGRITSATLGGRIGTNCGLEGSLGGTSNSIEPLTVTLV